MKNFLAFLTVGLALLTACQPDPVLSLSKTDLEFDDQGGSQTIMVTANNEWHVLVDDSGDFYSVSPMDGAGDGMITVTLKPNETSSTRSARVAVVCTSHDRSMTQTFSLRQTCPVGHVHIESLEYNPPRENKVFDAEGGLIIIEFTANAAWTLTCNQSDVTLDQTSGSKGTFIATAIVPACPDFEGRTIKFTLTCLTSAGGVSEDFGTAQAGGLVTYGGEIYHAVKMDDGKWWMTENLRYVPAGMTPSSDKNAVTNGFWYPLVIDELTADKATVKFSTAAEDILANGYLYSTEVALGVKPGDITVENAASFEGVQGICPEGWHIPTKADIIALVGKTADKNDTNPNAPYFDAELNGGNGSAALLNAAGFNAGAWGAVSVSNAAATTGTTMGAIKAYQRGMNTGYLAGSTVHQVTTNDDGSLKNVQFVALMPNMNTGTYNGAWNNYRNGVSVRCVKNN